MIDSGGWPSTCAETLDQRSYAKCSGRCPTVVGIGRRSSVFAASTTWEPEMVLDEWLSIYKAEHSELLERDPEFARWLEDDYIPVAGGWEF